MDQAEYQKLKRAIDLAVDRVVGKGTDDLFRPPIFSRSIESLVVEQNPNDFAAEAFKQALNFLKVGRLQDARIGPARRTLVAKDENTFRQVAWLDPFDVVKYLSLTILAFEKMEPHRPTKELSVVHSHRPTDDWSTLFDENFGYDSFRSESSKLSRARIGKWKVVTDIANFFDRIGNHTLENHLKNVGLEHKYTQLISEVLFFWAGDRRSFGVPVGSDGSRILSEAVLLNVDRCLLKAGITYIRYVDDFRIFADTKAEALKCVEYLTTLLADEGLSLNSRKTEIFEIIEPDEVAQMANRFAAGEHEVLDLEERIEIKRRIRVSGQSSISKFYREPGKEALKKIKMIPIDEIEKIISDCEDYEFESNLKLAVKYFVYANQDVRILDLLLKRRLSSIIYLSDALTKEVARFSPDKCEEIKAAIYGGVDWEKCAYPLQIPILRISACRPFHDPKYANAIVDNHLQTDSMLFFREAISLGAPCLDRARIRGLAIDTFPNLPDFVRRAIYSAVKEHEALSDEEKRPLLKNMKQHAGDWFIERIQ